LFQRDKVRIILVRRVTGLPGCWVAVMFNHLFYLGSRLGLTGCDQRAGPRRKRLSPGRRNVCHLADTTGMNPAAT
jgi:hypothetical protein